MKLEVVILGMYLLNYVINHEWIFNPWHWLWIFMSIWFVEGIFVAFTKSVIESVKRKKVKKK